MFRRAIYALDNPIGIPGRSRAAPVDRIRPPAYNASTLRRTASIEAQSYFEHRMDTDAVHAESSLNRTDFGSPRVLDVTFHEVPDPEAIALRARFDRRFPILFLMGIGAASLLGFFFDVIVEFFRVLVGL